MKRATARTFFERLSCFLATLFAMTIGWTHNMLCRIQQVIGSSSSISTKRQTFRL